MWMSVHLCAYTLWWEVTYSVLLNRSTPDSF